MTHRQKLSMQQIFLQASCFDPCQHSFPLARQGFCKEWIHDYFSIKLLIKLKSEFVEKKWEFGERRNTFSVENEFELRR